MRRRALLIAGLLLLGLLLSGCGIKGPLQPKGPNQPSAVIGLGLAQQGEELVLSWQLPTSNQDGSELTNLAGFEVYRLTYRPEDYCEECRDPEVPLLRIDLAYPDPALRSGNTLTWRDRAVAIGNGYRYKVVPVTRDESPGAAARVHRRVLPPPPAPTDFVAAPLDRGARLSWKMPSGLDDAYQWLGVQVYRASGEMPLQPITGGARTDGRYDDFGLQNDQPYRYGLRSVVGSGELVVESALSELLTVTPDAEH